MESILLGIQAFIDEPMLFALLTVGIFVGMVFVGPMLHSSLAWDVSDTFNGLMMIPNLIGVITLSPVVYKITKNYVDRVIKGKHVEPVLSVFKEINDEHSKEVIK